MWSVGELELRTFFIPTVDKVTKKQTSIPVSIRRVPLIHKNLDGTETCWYVMYNRGKFSLHYPDSVQDKDAWGFHRPNGQKFVKNADTGMDGAMLVRKLREKFPKDFCYQVISELSGQKQYA